MFILPTEEEDKTWENEQVPILELCQDTRF